MAQNKIQPGTPAAIIDQIRRLSDEDLETAWALLKRTAPENNLTEWTTTEIRRRAEIRMDRREHGDHPAAWYEPRPIRTCHHHDASGWDGEWECDSCGEPIPAPVPGSKCRACVEDGPVADAPGWEGGFARNH